MERGDGSFVPGVTRSFNLSRLRFLRELRPLMPEQSEWLRVMSYSLFCEAIPPEIEKRDRLNKAAGPVERKNRPHVPLSPQDLDELFFGNSRKDLFEMGQEFFQRFFGTSLIYFISEFLSKEFFRS